MTIDIPLKGFSTAGSDYASPDGALAASINAVLSGNAIMPITQGRTLLELDDNPMRLQLVHKVAGRTNYIFTADAGDGRTTIRCLRAGASISSCTDIDTFSGSVLSMAVIGNCIAIATTADLRYILWKDSRYLPLPANPEPITIRSVVNTDVMLSSRIEFEENSRPFSIDNDILPEGDITTAVDTQTNITIDDEKRSKLCNQMFGIYNRMVKRINQDHGFYAPFFIRFAYRMFDGSHIMATAPKLICPNSAARPFMTIDASSHPLIIVPYSHLDLSLLKIPDIDRWRDIITHIDVFISEPIINYSLDNDKDIDIVPGLPDSDAITIGNFRNSVGRINIINNLSTISHYNFKKSTYHYTFGELPNNEPVAWPRQPCRLKPNGRYIWLDANGKHDRFSLWFTDISEDHVHNTVTCRYVAEVPSITITEAHGVGLNVSARHKVWDLRDLDSIYSGHAVVLRNCPVAKGEYYTSGPLETLDFSNCVSLKLSRADENNLDDVISSTAVFRLVHSFDINDIDLQSPSVALNLDIKKHTLEALSVCPALKDEAGRGDSFHSKALFAYNNRLTMQVESVVPTTGDPWCNIIDCPDSPFGISDRELVKEIRFEIYDNSQSVLTDPVSTDEDFPIGHLSWLYYPNAAARAAYITTKDNVVLRIPLKPHEMLDGAFAFNGFKPLSDLAVVVASSLPAMPTTRAGSMSIIYGNKVRSSIVNNPWAFTPSGTTTIGEGQITALSSAVKPLSQGQFGQFPLYAFTSDGVWALEVAADGSYKARQPISRDVLLSPQALTQIEQGVVFASPRGIMLLEGASAVCISSQLEPDAAFDVDTLGGIHKLADICHTSIDNFAIPNFRVFIKDCHIVYDYARSRIILYNPQLLGRVPWFPNGFVFSLPDKAWGLFSSDLLYSVPSWPQTIVMTRAGNLVDLSAVDADLPPYPWQLLVTRPLKLNAPDILKTIDTLISRGDFDKGHVRTVLYGSRNLRRPWKLIGSSVDEVLRGIAGSPYKWFRVVLICSLERTENVHSLSFQFTERDTDQLR